MHFPNLNTRNSSNKSSTMTISALWTVIFVSVSPLLINQHYCIIAAPPPQPALPPCPPEFVAKFNNATSACEEEGIEALLGNPEFATVKSVMAHSVGYRNHFNRFRRAATTAAVLTATVSNISKVENENSEEVEEEADPEVMLCTFGKLKLMVPQLEIIEKQCSAMSNATNTVKANVGVVVTTLKPKDDLDMELQMASCLEEKLETMCPELSSVA